MKRNIFLIALSIIAIQIVSCTKSSNSPVATVTWSTTVTMSSKFEIPAVASRSETATADLQILSDNTLKYNITVSNLTAGDVLSAAHIHLGNAGTSGSVFVPFIGTISGSTLTGTVQLTAGQVDTIKNQETYVNVHSTQAPGGLIRGQIDSKVVYAADIALNGSNEVPSVTTTATGIATIRMTENKNLFIKVAVSNLDAGDALTLSHIHSGLAGANGSVVLPIYASAADFGIMKKISVDATLYASFLADPLYVNVHSTAHGSGLIRGQIR